MSEGAWIQTEAEMRESLASAFQGTDPKKDRITVVQKFEMSSPFGLTEITVEVRAQSPDDAFVAIRQKLDGLVIR